MARTERPLLADAAAELRSLWAELREMAGLRWQLTRLELHADVRSARRLAFVLLSVVVMGLTGLFGGSIFTGDADVIDIAFDLLGIGLIIWGTIQLTTSPSR